MEVRLWGKPNLLILGLCGQVVDLRKVTRADRLFRSTGVEDQAALRHTRALLTWN